SESAICQRLEISETERAGNYRDVRFFNHAWDKPASLRRVGVIPAADIRALSGGLFEMDVPVEINRMIYDYDQIIIAAGAGIRQFPELESLRLSVLKGQVLVCHGSIEASLIGKGYIALGKDGTCVAGSTYERDVVDAVPDMDKAKEIILPKIRSFFPEVDRLEVVGCKAAMRVVRQGHYFPIAVHIKENIWAFTALGSRGLLYHGLLGEQLVSKYTSECRN
ncbi:MAG: FAD-dependent oxidoreductase, partial [Candidatus Melainabacteria bacterium]|nr:FAD-dependent oxidoreductase [Candidatus Melainabacteria bacterium]